LQEASAAIEQRRQDTERIEPAGVAELDVEYGIERRKQDFAATCRPRACRGHAVSASGVLDGFFSIT
jgi:hypothetical protein